MPPALLARFAARIKTLREARGLPVLQVAALLGIDRTSLYSIERGRFAMQFSRLADLAEILRVDELDLFTFPDESDRHDLIDRTRAASAEALARAREILRGDEESRRRRR